MADKPLNQVTKVTDLSKVKTFLAVMDDNTIQQMSKEDMATVVGGLLDIQNIGVKRYTFTINNNEGAHTNLTRKGVYIISADITSSIIVIVYSVASGTPLSMIGYIGNTIGITNDKTIYVSSGIDGIIIKNNHDSVINVVIREICCEQ